MITSNRISGPAGCHRMRYLKMLNVRPGPLRHRRRYCNDGYAPSGFPAPLCATGGVIPKKKIALPPLWKFIESAGASFPVEAMKKRSRQEERMAPPLRQYCSLRRKSIEEVAGTSSQVANSWIVVVNIHPCDMVSTDSLCVNVAHNHTSLRVRGTVTRKE